MADYDDLPGAPQVSGEKNQEAPRREPWSTAKEAWNMKKRARESRVSWVVS